MQIDDHNRLNPFLFFLTMGFGQCSNVCIMGPLYQSYLSCLLKIFEAQITFKMCSNSWYLIQKGSIHISPHFEKKSTLETKTDTFSVPQALWKTLHELPYYRNEQLFSTSTFKWFWATQHHYVPKLPTLNASVI